MNWLSLVQYGLSALVGGGAYWLLEHVVAPDWLDQRRYHRELRLDIAREERAHERENAPTRLRIAAALRNLAEALYRVICVRGQFSLAEWQSWHNEVKALVESDAGARALALRYPTFISSLNHDQLCINIQTDKDNAQSTTRSRTNDKYARYEQMIAYAQFEQNVCSSLADLAERLRDLGFQTDADKYARVAQQHAELAASQLSTKPPF